MNQTFGGKSVRIARLVEAECVPIRSVITAAMSETNGVISEAYATA